jgi:nitrogen fixation/metabolism regulation signal transduction histidine kinase
MCLVIALLPAIPLSILVSDLLEKSFNVGLSETMEEALESGMIVSRKHLERLRLDFDADVDWVVSRLSGAAVDSASLTRVLEGTGIGSIVGAGAVEMETAPGTVLPRELSLFSASPTFAALTENTAVVRRRASGEEGASHNIKSYETENRAVQFSMWWTRDYKVLFYRETDPEFVAHADKLLSGRQLFAQLRLAQERLGRSFFYPFVIIYAIILVLSLAFAFLMAERLVGPIRRLVDATSAVAAGDWSIQLKQRGSGEIGRLVHSFNRMVSRLDAQRQRLIDLEKMASWREMARHLAHEIKNPLLPIRLTVQEMKDQYKGTDGNYDKLLSESVRVVEDELTHLQKLVKEFSSFAKMPGLSLTSGSIEQLVRDVAKLYPQVEIAIDAPGKLPKSVFDPDQLRRVLVNLFDNSLSVFPSDYEGKIDIRLIGAGENVALEFADNGPGIAAGNISKIFDPYFSTRRGGTGLGLAMVKNIILLHGGTIEASSLEGKGAKFTVTLPVGGPSAEPSGPPAAPDGRASVGDGGLNVTGERTNAANGRTNRTSAANGETSGGAA